MGAERPEFRLGRIVSAYLLGRNGKREEHPAIIISPDAEIVQPEYFDPRKGGENLVAAIGVSTQYRKFSDPYITLPSHPAGHPVTSLTRDCAAILNWYAILDIPDDCEYLVGDVPPALMHQINAAVRAELLARLGSMMGSIVECMALLKSR